jgi:PQQ-dependent dehydrogenase (methanol/ethanol family)
MPNLSITSSRAHAVLLTALASVAIAQPSNTDWPLLGRNADMQHNSPLAEINDGTVARLGPAWAVDMPSPDGLVGNPLIVDGVVYQSGPMAKVYANDLRTGKALWTYSPQVGIDGAPIVFWGQRINRGLAVDGDKVFVGAGDCKLHALDRKTGKKIWTIQSCDASGKTGWYTITGAPRVGGGLVFMGNACGDSGSSRGYVDAYDQKNGKRKWRFYTVPADPAKGKQKTPELQNAAKTWGTGWYAKSHGCGSVWEGITFDEKLNQLYIGVDGPSPWNPKMRAADAGDELYTNSIVALDASTGRYKWHYKVTPNDGWNYTPTNSVMLAELPLQGGTRRVVMAAPKNGFFYLLDAKSGQFISAKNITPVNWASHIDPKTGRPVTLPDARYWEKADGKAVVLPSTAGAHNWQAMSFNEKTGLVYIPVASMPTLLEGAPDSRVGGTVSHDYYGFGEDPKWKAYGELVAWDPVTQEARWRARRFLPNNGGTLTTAGNIVFQGTADGKFEAYAADSGKALWSFDVGGAIVSAPSTVEVDGRQFVVIASGNAGAMNLGTAQARASSTMATRTQARLIAFALDGKAAFARPAGLVIPKPPLPRGDAALAQKGETLYESFSCAFCHGHAAESAHGAVKDLRMASAETHQQFAGIVLGGLRVDKGMPPFGPLGVTMDDVTALQAYVLREAWKAYEAQQGASGASGTAGSKPR